MSTYYTVRSFTNHASFRFTSKAFRLKYLISVLLCISLVACGDSTSIDSSTKIQNDEDDFALKVTQASWDAEHDTLSISGLYNDDFPDAPDDDTITITIRDAVQEDIIFTSRKFDSDISEWEIEIKNPMPPPCRITAEIAAEDDTEDDTEEFSDTFIVEPPPQDCGGTVNLAPIAVIMPDVDQSIMTGSSIDFMGSNSSDPDGNTPLTYRWEFPGGTPNTSTMDNPIIAYNTAGTFNATLIVTDSKGLASASVSIMVTVVDLAPANNPPLAVIMPVVSQPRTTNIAINFVGSNSTDPDGNTPLSYMWEFPGGTPSQSTQADPATLYDVAGSYSASLIVTDSLGLPSVLATITFTVIAPTLNNAPTAVITPSTTQAILTGAAITFSGVESSDPDSNVPLTYLWDFPGGMPNTSMLASQEVIYSSAGSFIVSLIVTDSLGLESIATEYSVTVEAVNQAPTAAMTPATDMTITAGSSVTFMDNGSSDPDSNTALIYDWQFPGGNPASSANQNPGDVLYNMVGTYIASLQVTDASGMSSSLVSINILVTDVTPVNLPPNGNIQSIPMVGANNTINITVGSTIEYSGIATDPDGADTLTYEWLLPGGDPLTTSTLLNPGIVTYPMIGSYTTTFTVTDSAMNVDPTPATLLVVVSSSPQPAGETVISLIVLNDLHAHLSLHDDLKRNADGSMVAVKRGGLARIVTEINMIRNENANSMLMNIGDTFHGGVEAFYSLGNDIVTPVNALGIDIGVPGNWDFAYGPNVTRARYTNDNLPIPTPITITQTTFPNLAANVTNTGAIRPSETLLPATFTKTVAGVKIAFIGITSDMVPFMSPLLATGMTFLQGETNYVTLINNLVTELNSQVPAPDIVVVMSELGIHKDRRLADLITQNTVDVFFSAHTHELTMTPLQSTSGALVVEAGNDTYLGRMDVTVLPNSPNTFSWRVIPIEETILEDAAMKGLVDAARSAYIAPGVNMTYPGPVSSQSLTMPITTPLTTTSYLLSRRNSLENSFNNLMTDLIMNPAVGTVTDIAVTTGFRFDSVVPGIGDAYEDQTVASGVITVEDIYRFFPVPYILATATISGQDLQQIIETNLTRVYSTDVFQQVGSWIDGYAGLTINLNLANPDDSRVLSLINNNTGIAILPTDILSITGCTRPFELNSSSFCSNGTFSNIVTLTDSTGAPLTAIDYIIGALNNNENANFPARGDVNDSSNSPMWPASEFIQPISGLP